MNRREAKLRQDHWEEELMKSIEVNRREFQAWLDVKCFYAKMQPLQYPLQPKECYPNIDSNFNKIWN
jgi:hypothetical protein